MSRRRFAALWSIPAGVLLISACGGGGTSAATATSTVNPPDTTATGSTDMTTTVAVANDPALGSILVGPGGLALYVFANDAPGVSNCNDGCAELWLPLTLEAGVDPTGGVQVTGTLGVVVRVDGARQVTVMDRPLYYYSLDTASGQTLGQGVGGVWSVVSPSGEAQTAAAGTGSSSPDPDY